TSVVQRMFFAGPSGEATDHSVGRSFSSEIPSPPGPRHWGHCAAALALRLSAAPIPNAQLPTPNRFMRMEKMASGEFLHGRKDLIRVFRVFRGLLCVPWLYTRRLRSAGRNSSFAFSGAPSTGVPAFHAGILCRLSGYMASIGAQTL